MDGLKTEEDGQENKGPISSNSIITRSSSPVSSGQALNFFQCLPCDPKAMAADHHMYCLRRCFEQLMNTLLVVSAEIERIKAGVSAGLEKDQTTDIDESNKEDNRNASDHPEEQGNEHALPSKVQDGGDAEEDDRNKSDHPEEQGNEQDLPGKTRDGGYAEEDNGNASDHPGEQGNEHDLPGKTPGGGYAEEDNGNASDHPGEQGNEHAFPGKVQDGGDAEEDDRNKSDHPEEQGNEQDLPGKTQDGGDAEEDDRNASDHPEEQGNEHDLPSKAPGGGDAEEITNPVIPLSMADEDNTQSERETQNLLKKLDECITKFDQKRQVLQDAIESEIEAVKKDQKETKEIRSILVHEPGDTSSNLETGSREIASVNQWLNQKALIGGDATGDQDQGNTYSVLIVDDDRNARDAIQRYTIRIGAQKHCTMEFQEAKNGKEAVYLHLAGASFDLIVMDDHMPIMTGIQATQLLRKMGVKSQIVGVTSEPDHQAFIDAGFNTCVRKPRSIA
ncbi:TWO-COMPONENT RESPONSE REGULATOR [Salix purpurea]|uniref:TWO-COMPONENT RESPONSE REGULATOR n=1 Tax=Salix purpurea TaxID=77065 RepID=A0A9Q0T953_SALPP|nr:TWO-COMPONENT RESPONSE REGULATOR [Salix purpurea]